MSFPTAHYHADSDADDEYERSILTSPMPPTDDETSSIGDSEHGSHEHTPTTFEAADYGRASPRTLITDWSSDECAGFLNKIGLGQYGRAFRENEIVGEAMVQLHHDELKEMGVKSMGHRLTILGAIYDTKVRQDVDIDSDHYIPPSKEEDIKARQATQEDLSRIIESIAQRDRRILETEQALKELQEKYNSLRSELLPIATIAKNQNSQLPSPIFPNGNGHSDLRRTGSLKNKNGLVLNPAPTTSSPTWPPAERSATSDKIAGPSAASTAAAKDLAAAISGITVAGQFPSPNFPSPGVSPGVTSGDRHQAQIDKNRGYGSTSGPYNSTDSHYGPNLAAPDYRDSYRPPTRTAANRGGSTPSIIEDPSKPEVEVFKSFRVSMDDPCHKVLPAALKRYNIEADWKQYALYIVYGDQERCLGLEEKPLIVFKQLDKEGRKPMFMLRRHVTPEHGFTGPNSAAQGGMAPAIGQQREGNGGKLLPGGVI